MPLLINCCFRKSRGRYLQNLQSLGRSGVLWAGEGMHIYVNNSKEWLVGNFWKWESWIESRMNSSSICSHFCLGSLRFELCKSFTLSSSRVCYLHISDISYYLYIYYITYDIVCVCVCKYISQHFSVLLWSKEMS